MLIIFQSRMAGDLLMFEDVAYRLLEIIGKEPSPRGIITVEQLPNAIERLQQTLIFDRSCHAELVACDAPSFEKMPDGTERPRISLTQRAIPLLDLCKQSLKKQAPIIWGI